MIDVCVCVMECVRFDVSFTVLAFSVRIIAVYFGGFYGQIISSIDFRDLEVTTRNPLSCGFEKLRYRNFVQKTIQVRGDIISFTNYLF